MYVKKDIYIYNIQIHLKKRQHSSATSKPYERDKKYETYEINVDTSRLIVSCNQSCLLVIAGGGL